MQDIVKEMKLQDLKVKTPTELLSFAEEAGTQGALTCRQTVTRCDQIEADCSARLPLVSVEPRIDEGPCDLYRPSNLRPIT